MTKEPKLEEQWWEKEFDIRLDNSINYNWTGGFKRQFLKDFIRLTLAQQKQEIKSKIPKIYCPLNKLADDGVHIVYKCLDCGQTWGEEEKTPLCLNAKIRLADLLKVI